MDIIVNSRPSCYYCHALMDWLDRKGIKYEERLADDFDKFPHVPVTEISGQPPIVGFDRPALKKALKEANLWP